MELDFFGSKMLSRTNGAGLWRYRMSERDSHFSNDISSTTLLTTKNKEEKKYIDLGCIVCKMRLVRALFFFLIVSFLVIGLPMIVYKHLPGRSQSPPLRDEYATALHEALLFFNA